MYGRPLPTFLGFWFKHDPFTWAPEQGDFQFLTSTPCYDPNYQCWNDTNYPQISFDNLAFHTLPTSTSVPEPSALLLVAGALGLALASRGRGRRGTNG